MAHRGAPPFIRVRQLGAYGGSPIYETNSLSTRVSAGFNLHRPTWSSGRLWLVSALMMSKFHLVMRMVWLGAGRQGLTLVHFSAQPEPFWSHLLVSTCIIDWEEIMHPTYSTKRAYVEPKSGPV